MTHVAAGPLTSPRLRHAVAAPMFAVVALLTLGLSGAMAATVPISATGWRAILVGPTVHGGATTLLQSDGRGSVSVKVSGVAQGQGAVAYVTEARCGSVGRTLAAFSLRVDQAGTATGKLSLTPALVAAYAAARHAGVLFSIRVHPTTGGSSCGNQIGAPPVGTVRLRDQAPGVFQYDMRFPVVSGLVPETASAINTVLQNDTENRRVTFVSSARDAQDPSIDGESTAVQTFSVSLAQPGLLSLVEHYIPEIIGAPHGDEQFFTFTFDLATGHRILLTELFRADRDWLAALSRAAIARLQPTMGSFAGAVAGPIATNFGAWRLAPGGLQITFAQAQGFSVPITTITIPWSALSDVLNPQSPIARLLTPR